MNIANDLTQLIGNTPLVSLSRYAQAHEAGARLLAKVEFFNPLGSVKDRAAYEMITDAEERGLLEPGALLVEPTSGNTGIGLAWISAIKGYRLILTMPESMSEERKKLLRALGAELILTPASEGMDGAVRRAQELAAEHPGALIPGQFVNPVNARAHYRTTGPEIWFDTDGQVDIFVAGVGTGGTVTGVGEYLKERNPEIRIVAVEPSDSPLLSQGKAGPHKLQGIGANFVPEVLGQDLLDEIFTVSTQEAFEAAREAATTEGLFVGISSGAALYAAKEIAKRPENKGKTVVVLLPDTGDRYLSTQLFAE